jgi:hypothetical protein
VALLGLLQAWSHRLIVDYDGVSYLDVADNYAHGAWSSAINGYWSPLYSWLLAIVIYPLKFLRFSESTLLHLVNFSGYLGPYGSFEFFLRQLIRSEQNAHSDGLLVGSESAWNFPIHRSTWPTMPARRLFMVILQGTVLDYFNDLLRRWVIWLPATAAVGMYALVLVQPRYIAPFVVMLWLSLFAAVRLPRTDVFQLFVFCAVLATVLATGVGILRGAISDSHSLLRPAPDEQAEIAEGLHKLGVLDGQSIATIGIPRETFYWARLARLRIVSEIPTENVNQFWFASPGTQEKVRSLFAQTGAIAVVTDTMPAGINLPGWEPILRFSSSRRHCSREIEAIKAIIG